MMFTVRLSWAWIFLMGPSATPIIGDRRVLRPWKPLWLVAVAGQDLHEKRCLLSLAVWRGMDCDGDFSR